MKSGLKALAKLLLDCACILLVNVRRVLNFLIDCCFWETLEVVDNSGT